MFAVRSARVLKKGARKLAVSGVSAALLAVIVTILGPHASAKGAELLCEDALAASPLDRIAGKLVSLSAPCRIDLPTFQTADGGLVTLRDFKGAPTLMVLWATWCGPCVREMPALDKLQQDMGTDKLKVVAIAQDQAGLAAAESWLERRGLTHLPAYADPGGSLSSALGLEGIPFSLLLNADGKAIAAASGAVDWNSAEARQRVKASMTGKSR